MAELFLGELVDPATHERTGTKVQLPSGDFTTHGVIVGMTGSGKTGLGLVLIEECLRAGVPCVLIDPKGDLTNLCLTFPGLAGSDFEPWVNDGDAQKAGLSVADFATQQATTWKEGLSGWGLGPDQIKALRDSTSFTIYTPGSMAGVPLNIVGSLQAPADTSDMEVVRDEVEGYVSGLLGLVGIEADPLSSREHILLSNLIETCWTQGRSLDLPTLVAQVQQPPIRKLGVFELDAFFPPKDRTELAMKLNGLLASPSFAAWGMGQPIDIDGLIKSPEGKPCAAIVTTSHLSDEERQFVTALVLSKVVTWMRRQSGTTDLRMLVYMDEVAGYVPPTAVPPTKKPIMLLMKQARAFGIGTVLATQNPVDVDYKAISNAGTWMVGRLQTERDKGRLLDGMSAAAGGVDVAAVGDTISGLAKREFVLRRAGKDTPEVLTSRWAMSYLRGPLTRDQIQVLTAADPRKAGAPAPAAEQPAPATPAAPLPAAPLPAAPVPAAADESPVAPEIAATVPVSYLDPAAAWASQVGAVAGTRHHAAAVARVAMRFDDEKADLVADQEYEAVLFPLPERPDPSAAASVDYDDRDLRADAPPGVVYGLPLAAVKEKRFWTDLERSWTDHVARNRIVEILVNRPFKLYSRVGETKEEFAARCQAAADDKVDAAAAKLRDKYETKVQRLQQQLLTAQGRVDVLATEAQGRQTEELLSAAGSILGGFLGGRRRTSGILGSLGSSAGRRTRSSTTATRLQTAQGKVADLQAQAQDLEADLAADLTEIQAEWSGRAAEVESVSVPLEKSDVRLVDLRLVWVPVG
jgi:Helicase HerA, central domain